MRETSGVTAPLDAAPPIAGLVLAAGAGRRMGGPKALLTLTDGGPTLVELAVTRLLAGGCPSVVTVVGAQADTVGPYAASTGSIVVVADDWAQGMGASLRRGLQALEATRAEAAVVTLVDLPDVIETVIARVLESLARTVESDDSADVARGAPSAGTGGGGWATALGRAAYGGKPGHPVVLGRTHWPAVLASATGDRGARAVLATGATLLVECGDLATGRDWDRRTDQPPRSPGARS